LLKTGDSRFVDIDIRPRNRADLWPYLLATFGVDFDPTRRAPGVPNGAPAAEVETMRVVSEASWDLTSKRSDSVRRGPTHTRDAVSSTGQIDVRCRDEVFVRTNLESYPAAENVPPDLHPLKARGMNELPRSLRYFNALHQRPLAERCCVASHFATQPNPATPIGCLEGQPMEKLDRQSQQAFRRPAGNVKSGPRWAAP
jgi:hypothetical protein